MILKLITLSRYGLEKYLLKMDWKKLEKKWTKHFRKKSRVKANIVVTMGFINKNLFLRL